MVKLKNLFLLPILAVILVGCSTSEDSKKKDIQDIDMPNSSVYFEESIKGRIAYQKVKDNFYVTFSATGPNLPGGLAKENAILFKNQEKWKKGWDRQFPHVSQVTSFVYNVGIVYGDVTAMSDDIDMSNPKSFYGIMYNQAGKPISKTYYKTMDYVNFILNHQLNTKDYTGGKELSDLGKESEIYAVLYFTTKDGQDYYLKCPSLYVEYASNLV